MYDMYAYKYFLSVVVLLYGGLQVDLCTWYFGTVYHIPFLSYTHEYEYKSPVAREKCKYRRGSISMRSHLRVCMT